MSIGEGLFSIGLFYFATCAMNVAYAFLTRPKRNINEERLEKIERTLDSCGIYE